MPSALPRVLVRALIAVGIYATAQALLSVTSYADVCSLFVTMSLIQCCCALVCVCVPVGRQLAQEEFMFPPGISGRLNSEALLITIILTPLCGAIMSKLPYRGIFGALDFVTLLFLLLSPFLQLCLLVY